MKPLWGDPKSMPTQEADKALEEKARDWLTAFGLVRPPPSNRRQASSMTALENGLADLLREVAEDAKREEAAEWEKVVVLVRDGFRTAREDPQTARWICDEILRRRGGKP